MDVGSESSVEEDAIENTGPSELNMHEDERVLRLSLNFSQQNVYEQDERERRFTYGPSQSSNYSTYEDSRAGISSNVVASPSIYDEEDMMNERQRRFTLIPSQSLYYNDQLGSPTHLEMYEEESQPNFDESSVVISEPNIYGYEDAPGRSFGHASPQSISFYEDTHDRTQLASHENNNEEENSSMNEETEHQERRASIRAIMTDQNLTPLERRRSIQEIMDGRARRNSLVGSLGSDTCVEVKTELTPEEMEKRRPLCTHYKRSCTIISPCCGLAFGCRVCHDECADLPAPITTSEDEVKMERRSSFETSESHKIDRFKIKEIICRECYTRQDSKRNKCVKCGAQFGEYHCSICNLWMSLEEQPYHCKACGFCRLGGSKNYVHCHDCGICIDAQLMNTHECKQGKYMSNCPVCQEDLFSSRAASHELPCGHAIHWHCYQQLSGFDSRCPVCKKTTETPHDMAETWRAMAATIEMQPIPTELAKVVHISCNDCEKASMNCRWHLLGVQCKHCNSFNTNVETIYLTGHQAIAFLDELDQQQIQETQQQLDQPLSLPLDSEFCQPCSNDDNSQQSPNTHDSLMNDNVSPTIYNTESTLNFPNQYQQQHQLPFLSNDNFSQDLFELTDTVMSNDNNYDDNNDDNNDNHNIDDLIEDTTNIQEHRFLHNNSDVEDFTTSSLIEDVYIPPHWNRSDNAEQQYQQQTQNTNNDDDDDTSSFNSELNGVYIPRRWRFDIQVGDYR